MADLYFSTMRLIAESVDLGERFIAPTVETFKNIEEAFTYSNDGSIYEVNIEKHNEYVFFVFSFGNPEPRDERLTNINTGEKIPNQRTTEEAELNHQAFFLFHYSRNLLYCSNSQKKSLFESILKEKSQTNFSVNSIFKKEEDFVAVLKECHSISFTHVNNLFSSDSKQKQALIDLTGTDAPAEFTITAKYSKRNKCVEFIKKMAQAKRDKKIENLTICGKDETGFESVYNVDTFLQKIKISCQKDKNGKFVTNDVRDNLLKLL